MQIIRIKEEGADGFFEILRGRSASAFPKESEAVDAILRDVRTQGDEALLSYTARFDGVTLKAEELRVTPEEIEAAYRAIDPALLAVLQKAAERIRTFHTHEKRESWQYTEDDLTLGLRILPLARVGVYVPGGSASLSSSVLMNVIPAKVAGVPGIVMCTPPARDGTIDAPRLVAADLAGADEIYKLGGAQAIAAMAYGTESIRKCDKITGPGNLYVALAKRAVFGFVSIDSIAGPSEIVVLADETADPRYVAADLLSQAEHDARASAILITDSAALADAVDHAIGEMLPGLPRREIAEASLSEYGRIMITESLDEGAALVNQIAPEHLEIMTEEPESLLPEIKNAGAVFLGAYASEPFGDYMAGPNHVLPTNGTARFFSPLSVDDFIKKNSVIIGGRQVLHSLHEEIERFALSEGLEAHRNSVAIRFEEEKK